jgi:iron complex outermembrane receptor protein
VTPQVSPLSRDASAASFDANSPQHQWQLHSTTMFGSRTSMSASLFYVGKLRRIATPAYTRADANVEYKLTRALSVQVTGQNLFNRAHPEFLSGETGVVATEVPRNVHAALRIVF